MTLPLHLMLAGRAVVVIGGGKVAARKVTGCLAAGARVQVVSPVLHPRLIELHRAMHILWHARRYRPGDLAGAWLVFIATGCLAVDRQVERDATAQRTFCVRADDATRGTARNAAVLRRDGMVISVGTDVGPGSSPGADPHRVGALRDAIGDAIDDGSLRVPPMSSSRLAPVGAGDGTTAAAASAAAVGGGELRPDRVMRG